MFFHDNQGKQKDGILGPPALVIKLNAIFHHFKTINVVEGHPATIGMGKVALFMKSKNGVVIADKDFSIALACPVAGGPGAGGGGKGELPGCLEALGQAYNCC
ncbi:hypothetical protein GCM10010082_06790 [Kushneria pakistanensis]|uniref:Uncharacterized protein n=1 Tax=Kushneria pakistanensis TaxID=1508770 RepID=A0ABQ3FCH4_9GAMM|nr:hypothetical protein GCM10010082_06790 [Kushneria pakistanensis]